MIPRYSRPEMVALWTPERRYQTWLQVEIAAGRAMAQAGLVPGDAIEECAKKGGSFTAADAARIDEIEKTTRHDVIAFLTFLEERIGPAARHLHFGMTSSDVLDTSLAILLRDAAGILVAGIDKAREAVVKRALEHKRTPCIGRSHGIHAEPTTFGWKLVVWADELARARARLERAREGIAVGKLSGAVGTFAHLSPAIEEKAMAALGLKAAPASTQIIQRDRHAEYFAALALAGASIEKFAVEIRHLQRTEVREAEEAFGRGQKGSSAMPHKRNPVLSENLSGLARLLRGYALSALEDVPLWHERDISHSSVERVIGPDATVTLDFMLHRFAGLMEGLRVFPERMRENLELTRGLIFSQPVLLALVGKGMERQAAYAVVQRNAMKVWDEDRDFRSLLAEDPEVKKLLKPAELAACFDLERALRHVDGVFERVLGK
ncbi:MAG: adenylosuccinate lyase [Deltaproteobacteria bacterium 13_1_20CM_2_69_21]|nr:MAG: adenylosuccinate lyase [Deltaproteobacteria bacterium 13_1_40CM_4_68_19]OLD06458.1 MAG: adenylosuccinate lyase [Deltaproteobacteria bacterium 13_1_40CM_3_69_14]OLD32529.1 MAG: adenylosuccinate lyase [Myxococcales bacterium 13_1_40CM_2_68_15]OLE61798.1 MAG: adenylosuccinate lyase [Deltaproteobacteria bacterium 13_1_20CM_2_69_21]